MNYEVAVYVLVAMLIGFWGRGLHGSSVASLLAAWFIGCVAGAVINRVTGR